LTAASALLENATMTVNIMNNLNKKNSFTAPTTNSSIPNSHASNENMHTHVPIDGTSVSDARVTVSRRRLFSSAHLYHHAKLTHAENQSHFGACDTPFGHGHNYILETSIEGKIDPTTGLVINLTDLDQILVDVLSPLDHHHINFDVAEFQNKELIPTTENLAMYCRKRFLTRLAEHNKNLQLKQLRLYETDTLWVDIYELNNKRNDGCTEKTEKIGIELTRQIEVRAVHQLKLSQLSDAENQTLYGKCFRRHGHNYQISATISAPPESVLSNSTPSNTGLIVNREFFDTLLNKVLVKPFDGCDLNQYFANTSGEALAVEFYRLLAPHILAPAFLKKIIVQETPKNTFEHNFEQASNL
jgi:6-pyruvoyltetrahydropterin/6-carboxytetrahydropterin synthase